MFCLFNFVCNSTATTIISCCIRTIYQIRYHSIRQTVLGRSLIHSHPFVSSRRLTLTPLSSRDIPSILASVTSRRRFWWVLAGNLIHGHWRCLGLVLLNIPSMFLLELISRFLKSFVHVFYSKCHLISPSGIASVLHLMATNFRR